MKLPTAQEIETLHRKYASTDVVFDLVFTHSQIVWDIATQLVDKKDIDVDVELVRVGCLLHDIGVYPLLGEDGKTRDGVNYITHGVEGEAILKKEDFPEVIWRFASHHTGVGLSKLDITSQGLPLPVEDYFADTIEESLIMYADKFHSKTDPPYFNSYEWYKQDIAKFGNDKVAKFEQMEQQFGVPDLGPLVKKYGFAVR
jgi:uncharacterized protein